MSEDELISERCPPSEAERKHLRAVAEAVLFASPEPVLLSHLARALGQPSDLLRSVLEKLAEEYRAEAHGLQLRTIRGGYQLTTKPEYHQEIQDILENLPPPAPLSRAALETVAIIALRQPITAADIHAIRGVRNNDPIRTLWRRKLITSAGRAPTRGQPLCYKTTHRFLVEFGLQDLKELRTVEDLRHQPELSSKNYDSVAP